MSNESDTPRTDDNAYGGRGTIGAGYVSADFARQLERELAAMTKGRHEASKPSPEQAPRHSRIMKEPNIAPFFACAYAGLAETARKCGYALAIHGSVITDMDLVAIPWTEEATGAETVKNALMEHIHALDYTHMLMRQLPGISEENAKKSAMEQKEIHPTQKPHGRLAFNLWLYHGVKIDLSVMPRMLRAGIVEEVA